MVRVRRRVQRRAAAQPVAIVDLTSTRATEFPSRKAICAAARCPCRPCSTVPARTTGHSGEENGCLGGTGRASGSSSIAAPTDDLTATRLVSLLLSENGIGALGNAAVDVCQHLLITELYLTGNGLTDIAGVCSLTSLRELWVADNRLAVLPREIGQLGKLTTLRANGNRLDRLPPELCNCTALRFVELSHNLLTALPRKFGKLSRLQTLRLDSNRLTQLPYSFGALVKLKLLTLSGNTALQHPTLIEFRSLGAKGLLHQLFNKLFWNIDYHRAFGAAPMIRQILLSNRQGQLLPYLPTETWWLIFSFLSGQAWIAFRCLGATV